MPDWHVGSRPERQSEQALCRIKDGLDHAIETEVRLDTGFIQIAAPLAQLFGVVAPVPRRQLEIAAILLDERLQIVSIGQSLFARARPNRIEQLANGCRRLRHSVV